MSSDNIIYDGVSIKIVQAPDPEQVIIRFTDDITAFYKTKKAVIKDKGIYCCGISSLIHRHLHAAGIRTHFIRTLGPREQLCRKVEVIPLEVIVRNVIAGSLARRLGLREGTLPAGPIFDLCYKNERLSDPVINEYHALALGLVNEQEMDFIYSTTRKINSVLFPLFSKAGITLVDFKIEFGRLPSGEIVMADDITPDSARFWDAKTGERLDKDRFRHDDGMVGAAYQRVWDALGGVSEELGEQ